MIGLHFNENTKGVVKINRSGRTLNGLVYGA